MSVIPVSNAPSSAQVLRKILRDARRQHGLSQMELALRLGYSPRHISFVEVGRARPSRTLIERWLTEVSVLPSVRSAALLHAGYAHQHEGRPGRQMTSSAGHHAEDATFGRVLAAFEPFPAYVFDADWFIRSANRAASWLMQAVMPDYMGDHAPSSDLDMILAYTHPAGLLSRMTNARLVGYGLLAQLELEASANPQLQSRMQRFAISLADRFDPIDRSCGQSPDHMAVSFDTADLKLDFFRFQSIMNLPQDVTLHSLRVEAFLPVNDLTRIMMQRHCQAT
jgi:transcriptional regulator with XRE-family HTH domain